MKLKQSKLLIAFSMITVCTFSAFGQQRTNQQIISDIDSVAASDRSPRLRSAMLARLVTELESVYRTNINNSAVSAALKTIEIEETEKLIGEYKRGASLSPAAPAAIIQPASAHSMGGPAPPSTGSPTTDNGAAPTVSPIADAVAQPLPTSTPLTPVRTVKPKRDDRELELDSVNRDIRINPNIRVLFGIQQSGASSASTPARPYADLLMNIPLGRFGVSYKREGSGYRADRRYFKNSLWVNLRLISTPNQALPNFGDLTAANVNTFLGSQSAKINDLVESFDLKIGWETTLRPGLSFIASMGATNPLTTTRSAVIYKIPQDANGDPHPGFVNIFAPNQDLKGIDNVVFTGGDRDRFMRNVAVGLRFRHQFYSDVFVTEDRTVLDKVYPATFDLTIGQDEVMTDKIFRKGAGRILKFDGLVPIKAGDKNWLFVGASFATKLTRKVNTVTFPFIWEAPDNIDLTGNNNLALNVRDFRDLNSDRDWYSFRFAVDLYQILTR